MRAGTYDLTQKLFPLNINTKPRIQRTSSYYFFQPYQMAEPARTDNTPAPHPIQPTAEKKEVPPPPEKPDPGDCCGSGCVRCVWDVYYDELEEYNKLYKDKDLDSNPKSKP